MWWWVRNFSWPLVYYESTVWCKHRNGWQNRPHSRSSFQIMRSTSSLKTCLSQRAAVILYPILMPLFRRHSDWFNSIQNRPFQWLKTVSVHGTKWVVNEPELSSYKRILYKSCFELPKWARKNTNLYFITM